MITDSLKQCSRCLISKTKDNFSGRRSAKDLLVGRCKSCVNTRRRSIYVSKGLKNPKFPLSSVEKKLKRNTYEKLYRKRNSIIECVYKIRVLINNSIRYQGFTKKSKTFEILGCTKEELHKHLENTWLKNYGQVYNNEPVHIDHIIPLSSAKTEQDVLRLNYYTNLQYLKPQDNLKKSDSLEWSV